MFPVNDYIYLDIQVAEDLYSSYCNTTQDSSHIYLTFGLYAKDCLFDLEENNYLITIRIDKSYFEKYGTELELNIERQSICCNTQAKLLEIIHLKLSGIHRQIFLESIILFLLYQSQRSSLLFPLGCDNCSILGKPIDVEKIQLAKNYILERLSENLTIPIIAGIVGTNQCYLKKGFKEVFNQTIFEFIQENRMTKAKYYLQNGSQNITEIANQVGYSSLSSFSQAYKNYYGISPMEQSKVKITNI